MSEPYRSDADPLAERLQELREELERLGDVAARKAKLEDEVRELERRIAEAETLEGVRIASPCNASWDAMRGDDRVRHCDSCEKDVYNVSGMTRAEATQLIRGSSQSGVCIRMFKRADGTVLTADCPVGVEKKRVRRLAMVGVGALAGVAGGLWAWAELTPSQTLGNTKRLSMPWQEEPTATPIMGTASPVVMGSAYLPPSPPSATPASKPADARPVPVKTATPVRSGSR